MTTPLWRSSPSRSRSRALVDTGAAGEVARNAFFGEPAPPVVPPTLVGTPDATATASATTVSVSLPAGIAAGDIGVAGVVYNPTNGDPTVTSEWTQAGEVSFSGSMRCRYYTRTMDGSESGTLTFTHPSANKMAAAVAVLRGVTGTPTLVTASGNDTNPTASVSASSVAVSIWFERGGTVPTSMTSGPAGFTVHDSAFGTGGGQTCASIASNLTPSSSSVGGGAWTPNVANAGTVTATFAIAVGTVVDPPDPTPVEDLTYPIYIAHRGGANITDRAENTTTAYALSIANDHPSTLLETDCAGLAAGGGYTAEERIALTHDGDDLSTNSRVREADGTTVVTGLSRDKTVAQWDTYLITQRTGIAGGPKPASRWYTGDGGNPGLADLLLANPSKIAMPEVKEPEALTPLIDSITARGLTGQTIVQSFDYTEAQTIAAAGLNALFLTNAFTSPTAAAIYAAGIRWVGVDRTIGDLAGYCTTAHAAGLKVIAYTVNSTVNRDAALTAGVDGMFTDRPDLISAAGAARVIKTLSTSWAVTARQVATTATSWSVTQRQTVTTSSSWSAAQRVTKTVPTDWAVRTRSATTVSTGWAVAQRVTKTTASTWALTARVTATTPQTWDVRSRAALTSSQQWAVAGRVVKTLSTSWDTQSTEPTVRVTKTVQTRWDLAQRVVSPLLTRWDVAQRVAGPTVTLGWAVRARVAATTPTRWDTTARATSTTPTGWEVRSRAATVLATSWTVQQRQVVTVPTTWDLGARLDKTLDTRWSVAPSGAQRDITFLGFDEHVRTITFAEHAARPVAFTPHQRTVTYQEDHVELHPAAREYYDPGPQTEPVVAGWEASFDGGTTWTAPTVVEGSRPKWLVAGPEADATDAVQITHSLYPRLRATDNPELIVRAGPGITISTFG